MGSKKIILLFVLSFLCAQDAEQTDLKENDICLMSEKKQPESIYYFSAVIYFSPDKWTLWINDQKIQPNQLNQLPFSVKVHPNNIVITIDNESFTLLPDQSFCIEGKKITNGDARKG